MIALVTAPATRGKPIDLAAAGFNDGVDWLNLPYLTTAKPVGGDAWAITSLVGDTVEIVDPGPSQAVVRTTGHWTDDPAITVETTYTMEPDQPYVTAETTFRNGGATDLSAFTGDACASSAFSASYSAGWRLSEVTSAGGSKFTRGSTPNERRARRIR